MSSASNAAWRGQRPKAVDWLAQPYAGPTIYLECNGCRELRPQFFLPNIDEN